jgi:deoxyribodipyrimidine photo-lyase
MDMNEKVILYIFRRDFRVEDNTSWHQACKFGNEHSMSIMPVFIFNPKQISPKENEYFSNNCVQFMCESLKELEKSLGKLYYFHGDDIEIINKLHMEYNIKCVAYNKDITPYARQRDEAINTVCRGLNIDLLIYEDYTMYPMGKVKNNNGRPYEIYTPFYRKAMRVKVDIPEKEVLKPKLVKRKCELEVDDVGKYYTANPDLEVRGGRGKALEILENIKRGKFRNYKKQRDIPAKECTTKLGAYIKFGCVSIREVFHTCKEALGLSSTLVAQLYFREFYYNVAYYFPETLEGQVGEKNYFMRRKYEKSKWNEDNVQLERWKNGQTGYPMIDAGMRSLVKTGWMHNRVRMMAAMLLVRTLGFDWRIGEKFFAQHLVDYDPVNNSQGWCWVLTYRRMFNPWRQTGKYDENVEYIKKWMPELREIPTYDLVTWWEAHNKYDMTDLNYYLPMVEIHGFKVKVQKYLKGEDLEKKQDERYKAKLQNRAIRKQQEEEKKKSKSKSKTK